MDHSIEYNKPFYRT